MATQKKGLTQLHDLEAAEVSLVSSGANRRRFIIYKSAEGPMAKKKMDLESMVSKADPKVMAHVEDCINKYCITAKANKKDGDDDEDMDDETKAVLKAAARIMSVAKAKIPKALAHKVMDACGYELDVNPVAPDSTPKDDIDHGITKEHMDGAMGAATGAYKEHLEKLGYQKYPVAELAMKTKDGQPVMKTKGETVIKEDKTSANAPDLSAVDPETRRKVEAMFESVTKSNAELIQKTASLEAELVAQKAAGREKEIVAKAATFKHLGLPQEDIVATLKDADKLGKESFERVTKNFEALNTQSRQGNLFGEIGSTLHNDANSPDAIWAKIEKMGEGLVQKSNGSLSKAQAVDAYLKTDEGKHHYNDYDVAKKARVKGGV